MKRLGTFSGGGIRGIEELELLVDICRRTGKKPYELFDLVGGTSTGGIISLLLADGWGPEEAKEFYYTDGPKIFRQGSRAWLTFNGLLGSKYQSDVLHECLEKYLPRTMETAKVPVFTTTFDKVTADLLFMRSYDPFWKSLPMAEAATATASAPYFFNHRTVKHNGYTSECVDAGGGVNNPSREAITEAEKLFGPSDFFLVNFECSNQDYVNWPNSGGVQWMGKVLEYAQIISMRASVNGCRRELGSNFITLAPKLKAPVPMDSASKKDLDFCVLETQRFIRANEDLIEQVCAKLVGV